MRMDDVKFSILGLHIQEAHIVTFALFIISTILMVLFVRPRSVNQVESTEKKVLSGMKKLINQNDVIMQIEIGDEQKKEVFNYLNELNFKWINTIRHDHYFVKENKNS